jgi:hypothetical protein
VLPGFLGIHRWGFAVTSLLMYQNEGSLIATFVIIGVLAVMGGFAVWRGWGI